MVRELLGNIKGPKGDKGDKGEQGERGLQGPSGEVTTEQLLETREIVESKINDISVNVKDYGVIGDGTTDDTESLNHAISEIEKMGTDKVILIPKGNYLITDTVNVKNSLEGSQATLRYNGVGTALVVGDNSQAGLFTNRQYYKLPRVINRSRGSDGWDGTSVGVECVNLNTCEITVPFIQDFEVGLYMRGYSHGCSYNTVHLGALWDNHTNLLIDADEYGWSNQTLYLGGRLQHSLNKGAFENDPNAYQIKIGGESPSSNNTFINTSVEGYNLSVYRVYLNGSFNTFINNRFENHSADPSKIFYESNANYNKIMGGYHTHNLVEEFADPNTKGGTIDDGVAPVFKGTLTENQLIPTSTDYTVLKGLKTESHRTTFNNETGELFLKPGKWKVSVKVTFGSAEGGYLNARIVKGTGTVIASQTLRPDSQYQFSLVTEAIDNFIYEQPLRVEIRQTTTTPELNLNRGQFTTITATYLGGI